MSAVPTSANDVADDVADGCSAAIEADLGWALGVVFRSYLKIANIVMTEVPGGPRGYQVLAAAEQGSKNTQLVLAQQLGIDRTVMTYLLDDLEGAGLIRRQPDPADRRARRIVVTQPGREFMQRVKGRLDRAESHVLGVLRADERETFRALLRRLALRADALDPAQSACGVVEDIEAADGGPGSRPRRR
jgi:DNA-binding MarR family transcriptional regulator